jgi:pimeloyl-ACP methyl ester carboxylesterase
MCTTFDCMPSVDIRTSGRGPDLLVIPGTTRYAVHYDALAAALADAYTVHVVQRRAGGPPVPPGYDMATEVADVLDALDRTGARQIFGHSYGGLIGLHVALEHHLDRLVAYEPPVSLNGSIRTGWVDEFEARLAAGRPASAYAYFLTTMEFVPATPFARPLLGLALRLHPALRGVRGLLPTIASEMRVAAGLDSDGTRYAGVTCPTLLLGGGRSPAYLRDATIALGSILPDAKVVITEELDHNGPDLSGPGKVAAVIRA